MQDSLYPKVSVLITKIESCSLSFWAHESEIPGSLLHSFPGGVEWATIPAHPVACQLWHFKLFETPQGEENL